MKTYKVNGKTFKAEKEVSLTKHGVERITERYNITGNTAKVIAQMAADFGTDAKAVSPKLASWVNRKNRNNNGSENTIYKILKDSLFIFEENEKEAMLITAYKLPEWVMAEKNKKIARKP